VSSATSIAQPTIDDVIEASSVVVHGEVLGLQECLSPDGTDAFTFVTLQVTEVLRGTIQGGPDTLTVRLPVGSFPDGSYGTVVGYPRFAVEDELVLFLSYPDDGGLFRYPLVHFWESVYRIFPLGNGHSAVVDGEGQPFLQAQGRYPLRGGRVDAARAMGIWDAPIDAAQATAALLAVDAAATWDGHSVPAGEWSGSLHLRVMDSADLYSGTCVAKMRGPLADDQVTLTGRCNAPGVGAMNLVVSGSYAGDKWTGSVSFSPSAPVGPVTGWSVPWASQRAGGDLLVGAGASEVDAGGQTIQWDVGFFATFAQARPLINWQDLRAALLQRMSRHQSSAGVAISTAPSPATCDAPVQLVGGTP